MSKQQKFLMLVQMWLLTLTPEQEWKNLINNKVSFLYEAMLIPEERIPDNVKDAMHEFVQWQIDKQDPLEMSPKPAWIP